MTCASGIWMMRQFLSMIQNGIWSSFVNKNKEKNPKHNHTKVLVFNDLKLISCTFHKIDEKFKKKSITKLCAGTKEVTSSRKSKDQTKTPKR